MGLPQTLHVSLCVQPVHSLRFEFRLTNRPVHSSLGGCVCASRGRADKEKSVNFPK